MCGVVVEPVTEDVADEAIRPLREAGRHGHEFLVRGLWRAHGTGPSRGTVLGPRRRPYADMQRPRRLPLRAAAATPPSPWAESPTWPA